MTSTSKVLITGGTGFVGKWMVKTAADCVNNITQISGYNRKRYETNEIDGITNLDYIVHLAPVLPDRVIKLAKITGARLLYCSSGIVYVDNNDTEYRNMKLHGERMCQHANIDHVIARLFTFFGDGLDDNKAITQFFKSARAGKPLKVYGDGSCVRSYMHGAEMGRQMWRILLEGERGHAYDVGSTQTTTMKRLAERIQTFTGARIEYIDADVPVPVYYPRGDNGIK